MKIGDLFETCRGELGLVIGIVERMYPKHPDSPPRLLKVKWLNEAPKSSFDGRFPAAGVYKVLSRS